MKKLISIKTHTINHQPVNTVNARELHEFLESKQDYSTWIKARIDKYEFQENLDFIVFHKIMENPSEGGRPKIEYYLTLDMAKELAMVENNSKGKQARKYFIEVEKKFKQQLNNIPTDLDKFFTNPNTILQIANNWKKDRDKLIKVEAELEEAKPKLKYLEQILQSKSLVNINQIAKDYGYSARGFNQMLANLKIQYKTNGQWVLFADYHNKGYTHSSTIDITHTDGTKTVAMHTMWTQKGRMFLYEILKSKGIIPLIEVNTYIYFKRKKANDV